MLISIYYIIFLTLDHNNCLRSVFRAVKSVDFKNFIVTVPSFDDIEY